jgi:flagellar FliL protein
MPGLAYLMTTFVMVPRLLKAVNVDTAATATATPSAEPAPKKGAAPVKKESVTMNKLLVNVSGTMGARYLLVSLALASTETDFRAKVEEFEPQLRDMACGTLAAKTLADLEKPGSRNLIRNELISGFNGILGGQVVQDIYLTEFAIQ